MLHFARSISENPVYMDQAQGGKRSDVLTVESCLKPVLEDANANDEYLKKYTPHIAKQWKPYDNGAIMKPPPGKVTWNQSCKKIEKIEKCLKPIGTLSRYKEQQLPEIAQNAYRYVNLGVIMCKHKDVLIKNGNCINEELFRNEKLECGLEKRWDLLREKDNHLYYACEESVSRCLYTSDMWERSCGKEVADVFRKLSEELVRLETINTEKDTKKRYVASLGVPDQAQYAHEAMGDYLDDLKSVWPAMKTCEGFPLSKYNLRKFVRHRDALEVICHRAHGKAFSRLAPLLSPLKRVAFGLKSWVEATKRICDMQHHEFQDRTEEILKCTNGEDEIFHCYKGIYLSMFQVMIMNGLKNPSLVALGQVSKEVYKKASYCAQDVYLGLRDTCGVEVMETLKDLREMLTINIKAMVYTQEGVNRK